jgi:hypothetical protein
MEAFLKPFYMGVIMAVIVLLGLWLAIPVMGPVFGDVLISWYPFLMIIPTLIIGGYTSARYMRSKYLSRYFIMGGAVGVTVMIIIELLTHGEGKGWFTALLIIAGGSISIFGSYIGSRWSRFN